MALNIDNHDVVEVEPNTEQRDVPAVGINVVGADSDAVAGAILRAQRAGHHPIVVVPESGGREVRGFADQLRASLITYPVSRNGAEPSDVIRPAARNAGFPGVILHNEPGTRIDYERSASALADADAYAVDAVPEPVVESDVAVLVAIPAFNEAETIGEVVESAKEYADEVLVVDDGSDDDTAVQARAAGATVIEHEGNRGYGASLKTAFAEAERARAEHLVILDGDGQHDPSDIPRLVDEQEKGAELVIGSRFTSDSETDLPVYRWVGLTVINVLTNLSLGVVRSASYTTDTQSGFRAYDRAAIESLSGDESIGNGMGASTDILHHAHDRGYEIAEVGTTVEYDVENGSQHHPVSHGLTLVSNLLHTIERKRPVTILGVPGFVSTLVGVGFGYWTFSTFINAGVFPIGMAITATFFALAGVFASFTAIILHSLNTRAAEYVE